MWKSSRIGGAVAISLAGTWWALAQPPGGPPAPGGFGGPDFFGGGPPGQEEIKLVEKYDQNSDGWLDREERDAARKSLADRPRRGPRGFGPPGMDRPRDDRGGPPGGPGGPFGRMNREPPQAGKPMAPSEVETYVGKPLYDTSILRTIFLEFEEDDWETELAAFKETDVEVPATLTVDGVKYPNVGVKFRGMSSFMMVPDGFKRSLNVSLDFIDAEQRLDGYKTINLLNCSGDESMLSTLLYSEIAREHIPAPQANFVRVVINGEYWGVYANAQQIDKIFTKENFGTAKGTRWKVPGRPGGDGGLRYLGDELDEYKSRYEMKSNDGKKAWRALVELCRVLDETPDEQLEEKLRPMLDIDGVLWFLALDNALVNSDGYWTRASDYYLFRDETGVFHLIPSDMNEAFRGGGPPGGPGGFGPPGGLGPPPGDGPPPFGFGPPPGFGPPEYRGPPSERERTAREGGGPPGDWRGRERRFGRGSGGMNHGGVDLDPLVGLDDERMPLRGRLLKLPHLREQYLAHVREIAEKSLDWKQLGPVVAQQRALIAEAVEADTRKLGTTEAFLEATAPDATSSKASGEAMAEEPPRRGMSLRDFAEKRREYLLKYQPKAETSKSSGG